MQAEASGLGSPIGIGKNGNARIGHIRRFACNPPERGHVLRLMTIEEHTSTLGEWRREQCVDNSATADAIELSMREHAETMGIEVTGQLSWLDSGQLVVCSKRLKYRPEAVEGLTAEADAMGITGTLQGASIQAQRLIEFMFRTLMGNLQGLQAESRSMMVQQRETAREHRETMQMLATMVQQSWQTQHQGAVQMDKLRAVQRGELDQMYLKLRELAADAESSDDPEVKAKADFYKHVGSAMEVALPFLAQVVMTKMGISMDGEAPAAAPTQAAG